MKAMFLCFLVSIFILGGCQNTEAVAEAPAAETQVAQSKFDQAKEKLGGAAHQAKDGVVAAAGGVAEVAGEVAAEVKDGAAEVGHKAAETFDKAKEGVGEAVDGAADTVGETVDKARQKASDAAAAASEALKPAGEAPAAEEPQARLMNHQSLVGQKFILKEVNGSPYTKENPPYLEFGENKMVFGKACNTFRGPALLNKGVFGLKNAAVTKMACIDGDLAKTEDLMLRVLSRGWWHMKGSDLVIQQNDGSDNILIFKPAAPAQS